MSNHDYSVLADEELLDWVGQGSHGAFSELVRRHTTRFYHVAYRFMNTREDAEDIVQECFLKLWSNPQIWQKGREAKFTTWFYRIIINRCKDSFKKKKESKLEEGFDIEDDSIAADENMINNYRIEKFNEGFAMLRENQRIAITLSFYEKLSNQEAAQIMGLNLKAFQSLLIRGKKSLKTKLISNGGL